MRLNNFGKQKKSYKYCRLQTAKYKVIENERFRFLSYYKHCILPYG